jgi:hypothetical protein
MRFEWLAFLLSSWADARIEGARAKLPPCGEKLNPFRRKMDGNAFARKTHSEEGVDEILIRARVPFWSKMHKWLRSSVFENEVKLVYTLKSICLAVCLAWDTTSVGVNPS